MTYDNQRAAIKQYGQVMVHSEVEDATPHRLVQLLMEGALEKITAAKGYMQHDQVALKGSHISWAIAIIGGLQGSLNKDVGGVIAQNLENLYDYMVRRLTEANLKNDPAILDEVMALLREIKTAWDAIPPTVQQQAVGGP